MRQGVQYDIDVLIVGAGPVGMLLSYQLDRLGISCMITERNLETTKWPKMDLTNCRSMEILRVLGLANDYRAQPSAVSLDANFNSIFITNMSSEGQLLADWVCHQKYTSKMLTLKANKVANCRKSRQLMNNAHT